jgi:hypothetical protein
MKDERVLAVAPQFNLDQVTRTVGDLVFTTERIVFAKTADKMDVVAHFLGGIGAAILARDSRKRSEALRGQPLEVLVAASEPGHRYEYASLASIEVKPRHLFSSVVVVRPRQGKRLKLWGKRADLLKVVEATPQLAAMGAPIRIA